MPGIRHDEPEKQKIIDSTIRAGHDHVFKWWKTIGEEGKNRLLQQLSSIDFDELRVLYEQHAEKKDSPTGQKIEPAKIISIPKDEAQIEAAQEAARIGEQALRAGQVAVFLVAGGQATRLGMDAPKGTLEITPIKNKSMFQHHAEKILALSRKYETRLPFYIMTSETNDDATRKFFDQHDCFGLDRADVTFFKQEMIPALDFSGRLILDSKEHVFANPNGHGGSLTSLKSSGALADMQARGIKHIFYFQVDNLMIKIADPVFLGYHAGREAEMSVKVAPKCGPEEKVGVVCLVDSTMTVIEYSDLPDELRYARSEDGSLKFSDGNLAIHTFDIDFIERVNSEKHSLPHHIAEKAVSLLDAEGKPVKPPEKNGLKFEKFVFDALGLARETVVMEVVREEEFAPIKNAEGADSPATARQMMAALYAGWLEEAGARVPRDSDGNPRGPLEISPLFALDAGELKEKLPLSFEVEFPLYLGPE